MKGKHRVVVSTKRLKYDFELRRNLTIIRGDSATGKTTLIDMIQDYVNNPSGTPVELICDKKCFVLEGALWKEQLSGISDSIIFIDEGNEFIKTEEFAGKIQKTDNYYVIASRESLPSLPYSVEEIYGIKTSGKYGTLKQSYHEFYRIYGADTYKGSVNPEIVITEDSNSGYQFFEHVCKDNGLKCETLNGKSNVFHYLNVHKNEKMLVIADGAAFGSEIDKVLRLIEKKENIASENSAPQKPYCLLAIPRLKTDIPNDKISNNKTIPPSKQNCKYSLNAYSAYPATLFSSIVPLPAAK